MIVLSYRSRALRCRVHFDNKTSFFLTFFFSVFFSFLFFFFFFTGRGLSQYIAFPLNNVLGHSRLRTMQPSLTLFVWRILLNHDVDTTPFQRNVDSFCLLAPNSTQKPAGQRVITVADFSRKLNDYIIPHPRKSSYLQRAHCDKSREDDKVIAFWWLYGCKKRHARVIRRPRRQSVAPTCF